MTHKNQRPTIGIFQFPDFQMFDFSNILVQLSLDGKSKLHIFQNWYHNTLLIPLLWVDLFSSWYRYPACRDRSQSAPLWVSGENNKQGEAWHHSESLRGPKIETGVHTSRSWSCTHKRRWERWAPLGVRAPGSPARTHPTSAMSLLTTTRGCER